MKTLIWEHFFGLLDSDVGSNREWVDRLVVTNKYHTSVAVNCSTTINAKLRVAFSQATIMVVLPIFVEAEITSVPNL